MRINEMLFSETDYSCAFCGERQKENLTKHHIDGNKRNNAYDNIIVLCWNCHQRHNQKKGISLTDIKEKKKFLIQKTLTQYGVNALKMAYRKKDGVVAIPFLLHHLVDMGYMKLKEKISYSSIKKEVVGELLISDGTNQEAFARFEITPKGKVLYEKWL